MSNSFDSATHHIIPDLNSNDGKIMLAALISLIAVLSFVLLLHVYARWFLRQPRRRRRRRPVSHVPGVTHLHNDLNSLVYDDFQTVFGTDGLDVSSIAKIPLFIYKFDEGKNGLECAICLSVFEEDEIGRLLPKCQHSFHVDCIDMWLQSRSNCPICRATVAPIEPLNEIRVPESIGTTVSSESAGTVLHESCPLEVQIEMPIDSSLECQVQKDSAAAVPSGCSLKRMLSMNRSEQYWVFPSSSASS